MRPLRQRQGLAAVFVFSLIAVLATGSPVDVKPACAGELSRSSSQALPAELLEAIRRGDATRLRAVLTAGMEVDARDADGNTPLILAAFYGGPDCVKVLLEQGADPNAANKAGVTPLIRAAVDDEKTRLLLAAGADPRARTQLGNTPLILAARRHGNSQTVRLLLDHGAEVHARSQIGATAILAASATGDLNIVQLLLDHGADVNDQPTGEQQIFAGLRTPLMWAAFRNDVPLARLLLDRGADLNKSTPFGTPLTQAAWHDSFEVAELLLSRGANVEVRDFAAFTPLHWAAATESPRPQFVELLLSKGADPNSAGGDPIDAFLGVPQTPLMLAGRRGSTRIVDILAAASGRAPDSAESIERFHRDLADELDPRQWVSGVERAVARLQASAAESHQSFRRHASKQHCVSCHQQYLPMAAVGHARERSLRIDEKGAQQQVDLLRTLVKSGSAEMREEYVLQAVFHPEPAYSLGYEGFGLISDQVPAGFLTDRLVHHLAVIQAEDGRWHINLPRPPMQTGDVGATALAILTIKSYGWPGRQEEFDRCVDRGRRWLWSARPETNEEKVFQLLGLHWAGEPAEKLTDLAAALLAGQRQDGGWSQLETLHSDAYATGQVLYALARAAKHPVSHPAWQRGARFLLSTQHADGTWHVVRRAFPFQPTMSSGFPHGRDSWISAAGTSWAVLAITQAIEPSAPRAEETKLSPPAPDSAPDDQPADAVRVDFAQHIKPLLERSCLGCHGPEKPRSHFRVDRRETLLAGGASGEPAIVAGDSEISPLLDYVRDDADGMEMPPVAKRDRFPALTREEVGLLRAWIDQGAAWPEGVQLAPPAGE